MCVGTNKFKIYISYNNKTFDLHTCNLYLSRKKTLNIDFFNEMFILCRVPTFKGQKKLRNIAVTRVSHSG